MNYLDHLARESARFTAVLADAAPDAPVPSCPDWTADDLLWHLGEVQWFWGSIVASRLLDPDGVEREERPPDRTGLMEFFERASRRLQTVLSDTAPETEVWTWSADHSVGFIRRRQAHEALIHRIDAELTAGERSTVDSHLAADGVDEALRVMYGGMPPWGAFAADDAKSIRMQALDTGDSWLIRLGRFTGTDPEGTSYDEQEPHPDDVDSGEEVAATITGSAADLDCWLWNRPPLQDVSRTGDAHVLAELDQSIAPGIN